MGIVDIEEAMETTDKLIIEMSKPKEPVKNDAVFTPKPEDKDYVHAEIMSGNRYDPKTGEEVNKPTVQKFNYGNWLISKRNAKALGYEYKVLYNPFENDK